MTHQPVQVTINDHQRASQLKEQVQIGHYFVFVKYPKVMGEGRLKRLRVDKKAVNKVLPLVEKPVELDGITITPAERNIEPIGCVVSDRDLYHAQQDVVHLFITFPTPPDDLHLNIDCNGAFFTQRKLQLTNSVGIETFSMLLPGRYEAQLLIADCRIGTPVFFTVTQYALPPLSARLVSYRLKQEVEQLWFELAVESYHMPFTDELLVTLVAKDQEVAQMGLTALSSAGHYAGGLKIAGEGPFSLRLRAANDAERVAEVAIFGHQQVKPKATVISELGLERSFSMRPEQSARPLRGGYLTAGDFLATPLTVAEIVTEQRLIQVNADMESVVLLSFDLTTGLKSIQHVGDVTAGNTLTAMNEGSMSLVFIGGFVEGQPFEGYTTFIKPNAFQLTVDAPKTIRSTTDLVVHITCESKENQTIPVLLCVRDERITAIEKPTVNLGLAAKRGIDALTEEMDEDTFTSLNSHLKYGIPIVDIDSVQLDIEVIKRVNYGIIEKYRAIPLFKRGDTLFIALSEPINLDALKIIEWVTHLRTEPILIEDAKITQIIEIIGELFASIPRSLVAEDSEVNNEIVADDLDLGDFNLDEQLSSLSLNFDEEIAIDEELNLDDELSESDDEAATDALTLEDLSLDDELPLYLTTSQTGQPIQTYSTQTGTLTAQTHAAFPEVLFYDIVPVSGTKAVVIPLSDDALGTYTIEAFAVDDGDWTHAQTTVVIEQPVRVELALPPAIHPDDNVLGHLYAFTHSRQARMTLMCDGKPIEFKSLGERDESRTLLDEKRKPSLHDGGVEINTPLEMAFYVKPGTYLATVVDNSTGETDSVEMAVGEPGQFKSYPKELGLLVKDESIKLETTEALTLRVLPTLDRPLNRLITATANDANLGCEPTAAKILAATIMYLTAQHDGQRYTAQQIIEAGIAREQTMIRPGLGFAMYPNEDYISTHYSKLTVHYLWQLQPLDEMPDISNHLRQAVREGLSLAEQAAKAHLMQRMPAQIQSIEDAYMLAMAGKKTKAVRQFIKNTLYFLSQAIKSNQQPVVSRKTLAYAAASLIVLNYLERGLKLANQVTRQFNAQGRLYSTLDSVAAIALMMQLGKSAIVTDQARVRVNGQEMTVREAAHTNDRIDTIEVLEGVAAVEVTRCHEEDWDSFAYRFPVKVGFRDIHDQPIQQFKAGDRTDLVISLPDGYQTGDVVHVALPACLSWIQGGGKVKRFSRDFEGQDELRIPLVVTSKIEGKQHFAICVRNMFEEERATSPGMLVVESGE